MTDLEISETFSDFKGETISNDKWPVGKELSRNGWYAFIDWETAETARYAIMSLDGVES